MITVVADTHSFIVVNKPTGLIVHGDGERSLLSLLKGQLGTSCLHPVHRLDKDTSGLLLLAKTDEANRELCQAFAAREVTKFYVALTSGKPKKKQGSIKGDMAKGRGGSFKLLLTKNKPAITYLKSFGHEGAPRLWLLKPVTGKTHQLRVALKAWSCPIVGDERYGGEPCDRLYLHAYQLRFQWRGEQHSFQCLPESGELFNEGFRDRLSALGDPQMLGWQA